MADRPLIPPTRSGALIAAIAFNLVPVFGVMYWGWSVYALLLLYWMENVVIGAIQPIKMLMSGGMHGGVGIAAALFFSAFFLFHYGLFTFGHGIFVNTLFAPAGFNGETPLDLLTTAQTALATTDGLIWGFAAICGLQIWSFVDFVLRGEAQRSTPMELMGEPYARIMILHVTIIFGGMLVLALGAPIWAIVVLALIKIGVDVNDTLSRGKKKKIEPPAARVDSKGRI